MDDVELSAVAAKIAQTYSALYNAHRYNYLAQDSNGQWFAYTHPPTKGKTFTWSNVDRTGFQELCTTQLVPDYDKFYLTLD